MVHWLKNAGLATNYEMECLAHKFVDYVKRQTLTRGINAVFCNRSCVNLTVLTKSNILMCKRFLKKYKKTHFGMFYFNRW